MNNFLSHAERAGKNRCYNFVKPTFLISQSVLLITVEDDRFKYVVHFLKIKYTAKMRKIKPTK